ncbi:Hypothetical protein A7982_04100 [Minicystis rosea]|nr:Hypothetical protein A7982_04100 [Minicystis rosea]
MQSPIVTPPEVELELDDDDDDVVGGGVVPPPPVVSEFGTSYGRPG